MSPRGRSVQAEPGADGRTTVAESGQRPGARTPPPRRRRRLGRWAGGVVVVALAVVGYSVAGALMRPGNDTIAQRLAEWGRDRHLNWAVTRLEQAQYQLNKPKAGGSLAGGIPTAAGEHDTAKAAAVPHSPVPAPLPPFVANPAPSEGRWQDVVFTKGLPAVRITYLRPDDGHTSYLAAVMWLDPKLLTGRLHEGSTDPGGTWSTPDRITPALATTVAAAMTGRFRTNGGPVGNRGGYYDEGRVAEPLRLGAASLVIATDGTVTIGQWGRAASMAPRVAGGRQTSDRPAATGTANPPAANGATHRWGSASATTPS